MLFHWIFFFIFYLQSATGWFNDGWFAQVSLRKVSLRECSVYPSNLLRYKTAERSVFWRKFAGVLYNWHGQRWMNKLELEWRFLLTNCLKKARKLFKKEKCCTKSEKLLRRKTQSCSKSEKLLKSCRATYGQPYFIARHMLIAMMQFVWSHEVTYQTRETVFHQGIQTLRRELKIRRAAEYFWQNSRCLDSRWNTVSNVWYIFSIETKTVRSKRWSKIVKIYTN